MFPISERFPSACKLPGNLSRRHGDDAFHADMYIGIVEVSMASSQRLMDAFSISSSEWIGGIDSLTTKSWIFGPRYSVFDSQTRGEIWPKIIC